MKLLKKTFSERNLVIILFVMVLITFSFAQQDSKKLEKIYFGFKVRQTTPLTLIEKPYKETMPVSPDILH